MPKVSVIVPIFGAEQYIEKCARTLFEQTLQDIEYVFVNDGTKDKSIDVLRSVIEKYPIRKEQILFINLLKNQGVANARALGMKAANGDYVIHCDPDDWIDLELYESMYNTAIEKHADIVVCNNIYVTTHGNILKDECIHIKSSNPIDVIKNTEKPFWGGLCNKMIRRSLYTENDVFPYPGINYTEDLGVTYRLYYYGKTIATTPEFHYYYNGINENSACHQNNLRNWENMSKILHKLSDFLSSKEGVACTDFDLAINFLKFSQKTILLYNDDCIKVWQHAFPESHKNIMSYTHYSKNERRLFSLVAKSWRFYFLHKLFKKRFRK